MKTKNTKIRSNEAEYRHKSNEGRLREDSRKSLRLGRETQVADINRVTVANVSAIIPIVAPPYCNAVYVCSPHGLRGWCAQHSRNPATHQMTVERTVVNVLAQPSEVQQKMALSEMFHDYITPLTIVPDHSLPSELPMGTFSPNSLLMYEQPCDLFGAQGSGACSGINMVPFVPTGDTFDLNPVLEQSNDLLLLVDDDIGASSWSAETDMVKAEDAFVDKKGIMQGPTLAALNDDPSVPSVSTVPWIDDIETLIKSDISYTSSDCHMTQSAYLDDQCEREPITAAAAFFKPPQPKQPTCTVTKMSPTAFPPPTPDNPLPVQTTHPGSRAKSYPTARTLKPSATVTCDNSDFDSKSSLTHLLSVKKERDVPVPVVMPTQLATQCPMPQRWGVKRSPSSGNSNHSMDKKWEEIKQFIHDENEQQRFAMMRRVSAMQKEMTQAPPVKQIKTEPPDVSVPMKEEPEPQQQDLYMSDTDDSDFSDAESLASQSSYADELLVGGAQNKKRYFWQYNMQSKGPKGKRLCKSVEVHDPHVLNNFEDPVFDPELNHMRYKHNGKARRGDGNDVTPNPIKLYKIGNELCRLNNAITDMTPPLELPTTVKSKSRREKNKFASRACRLKKKAQHEANKVKLYGLQREHNQLMKVLESIKTVIVERVGGERGDKDGSFTDRLQVLIDKHLRSMVAGYTTEYVNSVLEHIANGDPTGGLDLE